MKHPHADLIHAWADGAVIQQYKPHLDEWHDTSAYPTWDPRLEYRIKPEEPRLRSMYLYYSKMEAKLWVDENPPEKFAYASLYNYVGRIEVYK